MRFPSALVAVTTALSLSPAASAIANYADDFIHPTYILDFQYQSVTVPAQQTVIQWANALNLAGPWSVTTKKYLAPSNDPHDYMSWRPYYWPNCTGVGNTTELTVDEMHKQCHYYGVDGALNPEARLINNVGDFDSLANAVLYNSLAWGITRSAVYSRRVAYYIYEWFLNPDTYMNPNLNYAQMTGGPDGQNGTHTGILDLKCMSKISVGVELLRQGHAPGWNETIDQPFTNWVSQYIDWITTNSIALKEKAAKNNHGTFYFAQLASLQIMNNDADGAAATVQEYFTTTFLGQINANGDQPLESIRTRPYHYLAYNLAAMITVGRLGEYVGYDGWNTTSSQGATIVDAAKFAMSYEPGADNPTELYPYIGAVAATYGDSDNSYAGWLNDKTNGSYVVDASYLWNQPLSDSGRAMTLQFVTFAAKGGTGTLKAGTQPTGASSARRMLSLSGSMVTLAAGLSTLFLL